MWMFTTGVDGVEVQFDAVFAAPSDPVFHVVQATQVEADAVFAGQLVHCFEQFEAHCFHVVGGPAWKTQVEVLHLFQHLLGVDA